MLKDKNKSKNKLLEMLSGNGTVMPGPTTNVIINFSGGDKHEGKDEDKEDMKKMFEKEVKKKNMSGMGGTNQGLDRNRYYAYDERSGSNASGPSASLFQTPDTSTQEQALQQLARELSSGAVTGSGSTDGVQLSSVVSRQPATSLPSQFSGVNTSDPYLRVSGQPIASNASYTPLQSLDPYLRGPGGQPIASNASFRPTAIKQSPAIRVGNKPVASNAKYLPDSDPFIRDSSGNAVGLKPNVEEFFKNQSLSGAATPASIVPRNLGVSASGGDTYSPFGKSAVNRGTDLIANIGDTVRLPQGNWQVVSSFDQARKGQDERSKDFSVNGGWGNSVLLRNTDTGETLRYSHLDVGGVNIRPDQIGSILKGGTPVGRVGVTGHTTGPHLDLEYTLNDKLLPIEKSRYASQLFPAGGAGGGKDDWYKGIGGKEDVVYGLDTKKQEDNLFQRFLKSLSAPVKNVSSDGPGFIPNLLYNLNPALAPGTPEDVSLIKSLTEKDPSSVGLITKPNTTVTQDQSLLGNRVNEISAYTQAYNPGYEQLAQRFAAPTGNNYDVKTNPIDKEIANRGYNTQGMNQSDLDKLRASLVATDATTRNNLFAAAAASRSELNQGQGRLREYIGRGRRDLSGTQAGADLSNAFDQASQSRLTQIANELAKSQSGVESALAQNVSNISDIGENRRNAERQLQLQYASQDLATRNALGSQEAYIQQQQDLRDAKDNTLVESLNALQATLLTQAKALTARGSTQEKEAAKSLYDLTKQRIEAIKQQLRARGFTI